MLMQIYWYQNWPERVNPFNLQKKMHSDISFAFVVWCNSAFWPEGAVQTTITRVNKSRIGCTCYRLLETAFVSFVIIQYNKTMYSKWHFESDSCRKCSFPVVCTKALDMVSFEDPLSFWNRLNAGPTVQPQLNH